MREILFRGKRIDNGEWVEGFYCKHDTVKVCFTTDDPKRKHLIIVDGFCDWGFEPPLQGIEVDPDTVGQYIGLPDMQDVKIFEGDIVQFGGEYGEIEYSEDEAMFHVVFNGWLTDFDHLRGADVVVIGNIHDNPELLEGHQ